MTSGSTSVPRGWLPALLVFVVVTCAQLWLVARAGTDVPFMDQWDAEGRSLYPRAVEGSLGVGELLAAHNEHRILWTRLLDLGLFRLNGQWDPLLQLATNAVLHGLAAALLAVVLTKGMQRGPRWAMAAVVLLFCLPFASWHNALWGFQSQVYCCVLFSLGAIAAWTRPPDSMTRWVSAVLWIVAAYFSMGPGLLVPFALMAVVLFWPSPKERNWRTVGLLAGAAVLALGLRASDSEVTGVHATSLGDFLGAVCRLLAWPYAEQPWLAVLLALPFVGWLARHRHLGTREGEAAVFGCAGWILLVVLAAGWARGSSGEFAAGVPSRYVDFVVLWPLVNLWCVGALWSHLPRVGRLLATTWVLFLVIGWAGASHAAWRGVIAPRLRDRDAPVRLAQEFQRTGDAAVFANQPKLYVPHPNPDSVRAVLTDPRLQGRLPPSFQPTEPTGPLSRALRQWLFSARPLSDPK